MVYLHLMERFQSLKKSEDFGRVYRQGRSYGNRLLVMYILERGQNPEGRIGISVSKRVGNSVIRHRVKRQLREIFRLNISSIKSGSDIVAVAKKSAAESSYQELESAVFHLVRRLQLQEE